MATTTREAHFAVTYRGGSVTGGRMRVEDLAPSLVALSRSIQDTQRLLEPLGRTPALDIHATREGSFVVDLVLTEGLLDQALDLLSGRTATAIVNLSELVGIVFGGFALVRYLRHKITGRDDLPDGMVRITFDTGQSITIPAESMVIAADREFREAAREVVAPLRRDGFDSVELSRDDAEPVLIERADIDSFDLPPTPEEQLLDVESDAVLRPVTVAFTEGNKWRVSDGESTFFATILDQPFLDRVQAGDEVFSKSDIIRARVRTRQYRDAQGELRTDRDVLRILEHRRGSRDVPLPFDLPEQ